MQQRKMNSIGKIAMLAVAMASSTVVMAQGITLPEPVSQEGRFMPGFGSDSIVLVRYSVKADGSTTDVETFPLMANQMGANMLAQNVKKWKFKPGTYNGTPVDIHNQEYLFVQRVDPNAPKVEVRGGAARIKSTTAVVPKEPAKDGEAGAPAAPMGDIPLVRSESTAKVFAEVSELVKSKDYDKALEKLEDAKFKGLHQVYDFALLHQSESALYSAKNQQLESLEAMELATMYSINAKGEKVFMLDDENLEKALRQKFVLAVSLRHNAEAMETYELLKAKFMVPADDKIHEFAKAVKALMDSPEPMALMAKITSKKPWTYKPVRRSFTVAEVKDGSISTIMARCERKDQELKYQADVDWALPASWGKCVLDFNGKPGTQFTVLEAN